MFSDQNKRSVREIVVEDLSEAAALFGHRLCAALTEADAVSLTCTFEDHPLALLVRGEVIAGHSIPAETPVHGESSRFAFCQQRGILQGQFAGPTIGTLVAKVAEDRKVWIIAAGKTYFGRSAGMSATTAREHSRKRLLLKSEDDSARFTGDRHKAAILRRRLAEELAMSEITKIKVVVPPSSGHEVGARDDRLGLQGFDGRIRAGLRRNGGGNRRFQIHADDGNYFSVQGLYIECTAISASDLSGDRKKKGNFAMIAGCRVDLCGSEHAAAEIEKQRAVRDQKGSGHTRIWLKDECLAFSLKDDSLRARGL